MTMLHTFQGFKKLISLDEVFVQYQEFLENLAVLNPKFKYGECPFWLFCDMTKKKGYLIY